MNNKIAIIDSDSICFSAFHPNKVLDSFGNPLRTEDGKKFIYQEKTEDEIKQSVDYIMSNIIIKTKCTEFIAFIKGKNTINYKRSIDSSYKADRSGEEPKHWNFVKNYLISKWNVVEVNNIEVDDAVNITRLALKDSFICCIDSDLLGLEGTHYNWRKEEWINTSKADAQYKFWSDMICGTHNNTKGLPRKGESFVKKLFESGQLKSYRSLVLDAYCEHYKSEKEGVIEFYKNYMMLKLLEVPDYDFVIPEPYILPKVFTL